jgi:hypothetical protein
MLMMDPAVDEMVFVGYCMIVLRLIPAGKLAFGEAENSLGMGPDIFLMKKKVRLFSLVVLKETHELSFWKNKTQRGRFRQKNDRCSQPPLWEAAGGCVRGATQDF